MDGLVRWSMLHSKSERSAGSKCHQPHAYRQSLRLSRARVLLDRFPGLCVGCDRGEHAQDGLRWRGGREDMLDCARHRRGDECDLVRVLWRRYLGHGDGLALDQERRSLRVAFGGESCKINGFATAAGSGQWLSSENKGHL